MFLGIHGSPKCHAAIRKAYGDVEPETICSTKNSEYCSRSEVSERSRTPAMRLKDVEVVGTAADYPTNEEDEFKSQLASRAEQVVKSDTHVELHNGIR